MIVFRSLILTIFSFLGLIAPAFSVHSQWSVPVLTTGQTVKATITIDSKPLFSEQTDHDATALTMRVTSVRGNSTQIEAQQGPLHQTIVYDAAQGRLLLGGKPYKSFQSIGITYNPILWGELPASIHVGQKWTVTVPPWNDGPGGTATVLVQVADEKDHHLVLVCDGKGSGAPLQKMTVSSKESGSGKVVESHLQYGNATWHGILELRKGLVVRDEMHVAAQGALEGAAGLSRQSSSTFSETLVSDNQ